MNDWRSVRLDQLGAVERGRSRHRPRNDPSLYGGHHPFVQTGDIKAAGLRLYDFEQTYSDAGLAQSRLWPVGTLCITIAANIGDTTILGVPACFPDSIVGFTANTEAADTVYVKYLLDVTKQRFASISRGATQDNLSLGKLLSQPLLVPPLETQQRVASILGAYDNLIEVNRRRVAILETMARGLFEEWFVRFRFPGHERVPLVETPGGLLPEGWSAQTLGDFLTLQRGFDLPATQRTEGPYPVISASGIHGRHFEGKVRAPGVVTGRSGTIGQVHLIMEDFWPLNTTLYVREIKKAGPAHATLLLQHFDLAQHSGGSAVPSLNRNHVHGVRVVAAPDDILARFEEIAMSCFKSVDVIKRQSAALASSRDLLLPRLISGQLSVQAAERELEEAA